MRGENKGIDQHGLAIFGKTRLFQLPHLDPAIEHRATFGDTPTPGVVRSVIWVPARPGCTSGGVSSPTNRVCGPVEFAIPGRVDVNARQNRGQARYAARGDLWRDDPELRLGVQKGQHFLIDRAR